MRAAVVVLIVLGLLAAVCATVLVRMVVRPRVAATQVVTDPEVSLLTAKAAIPAMTVVDGSSVTVTKVLKSQVPEGALTNSVQVVGKVLTRPMVANEVFSTSCFASDSMTGVYLASAVPEGKRAVAISLQESSGMAGIIYPGSVVDVLVSLEGKDGGEAVSTTMLQGLQVLAIGTKTVTSEQQYKDKSTAEAKKDASVNYRMVTLLVDPTQAQLLQLATLHGTVALSLRNPLDTKKSNSDVTRVSDFTKTRPTGIGLEIAKMASAFLARPPKPAPTTAPVAELKSGPTDPFGPTPATAAASVNPIWEMLIIRGSNSQTRTFPMSDVEKQDAHNDATTVAPGKG
jgi:pilus assembly protein CpaB